MTGRIMAIDPGKRRTGVAVSDPLGITARPLATLRLGSRRQLVAEVARLAAAHDVSLIVVGHPVYPSGEAGPDAREAEALAQALRSATGRPVELWDESFTTLEASARLRAGGRKIDRVDLDAAAAAVILEEFLRAWPEGDRDAPAPG